MRYNENDVGEIEVCADDAWHAATMDVVKNNSDVALSITLHTTPFSTSVKVMWSLQKQPNMLNLNISSFDVSCTHVSQGRTTKVRVVNIDPDVTTQVEGLLPDTSYECCVTTHVLLTPPVDIQSSTCTTIKTLVDTDRACSCIDAIGIGSALGVCLLLTSVGAAVMVICCLYRKHVQVKEQTR